jgi:hypothetical protein
MVTPELLRYFCFGTSLVVAAYIFVAADHLWKVKFFRKCLLAASALALVGIVTDHFRLVGGDVGLPSIVMSASIIYLGYFSLFRYIYKRMVGTEPYVTSASSTVGSVPLDTFSSAFEDGNKKKYSEGRRVTTYDFLFTMLQALVPAFTILGLLAFMRMINE